MFFRLSKADCGKFGSGSKQLICCSDFANLKDLQNLVHSFDPAPKILSNYKEPIFHHFKIKLKQ